MCGILGIIGDDAGNKNRLEKLNNLQQHRGPDSQGIFYDINKNVALAMTRLSIVDIDGGVQPYTSKAGNYTIVFNGEIYNNNELRKKLSADGHSLSEKNCEVETLSKLYELYGEKMLDMLNGMFALAIYDRKKNEIFIARDRYGIKPLYYYFNNNNFAFSSEIKVIFEYCNKNNRIRSQSVFEYFLMGYISTPKTIYEDIFSLNSGHFLKFSVTMKKIEIKKWWFPNFKINNYINADAWPNIIGKGIEDAIKRWSVSDVPISFQLSGGLDSSTLVALAASMTKEKIKTYTVGFEGKGEENWNEIPIAREVAKFYQTEHKEIILKPHHLLKSLDKIVCSLDQPYAGGLPSWIIYEKIAENEKVTINGTGGDEIFGNYNRGKNLFLNYLYPNKKNLDYKTFYNNYFLNECSIPENSLSKIFNEDFKKDIHSPCENFYKHFCEIKSEDNEQKLAHLSINSQMTDEFLMMTDRFSMAQSLEVRTPYLDHELVELVLSIPQNIRIDYKIYKPILRNAMKNKLPRSIFNSPKKGFSIPLSLWMRKPLRGFVDSYLNQDSLKNNPYIKQSTYDQYIVPMLEGDNSNITFVWSLLMFQLWSSNVYNS